MQHDDTNNTVRDGEGDRRRGVMLLLVLLR